MQQKYPPLTNRFSWVYTFLCLALVSGLFTDAWAHSHIPEFIETFFTPWHALLYGAYLAVFIFLLYHWRQNLKKGYHWKNALPKGYGLSLLGGLIFFFGGFGDMLWHTFIGIEENIDALYSPSHLALIVGGALIFTAAARSWLHQKQRTKIPAILSMTLFYILLTFFSQFYSPFIIPYITVSEKPVDIPALDPHSLAAKELSGYKLPMAGFIIHSAILVAVVLYMLRKMKLQGGFTIMFTIATAYGAIILDQYRFIPAAMLTGFILDTYAGTAAKHPRWTGLVLPILLYSLYYITIFLIDTVWSTMHYWLGSILIAGITGFLVSLLFDAEHLQVQ